MKFRPCIDLHNGQVKQIVGGSLSDHGAEPETNFVSTQSSAWYAQQYQTDQLTGGHIIKLGPNNDEAAKQALAAWPSGMQIGGGITADNARQWIDAGASHVIVTSYIFNQGRIDYDRLERLVAEIGKERLVLDLSCRLKDDRYYVVTDRWQVFTDTVVDAQTLADLGEYCAEFLVHAVDVEGKQQGIDERLIALLAQCKTKPIVYAGGVRSMQDLQTIDRAGSGKIDVTIGSALDLFGGPIAYRDVVDYCRAKSANENA